MIASYDSSATSNIRCHSARRLGVDEDRPLDLARVPPVRGAELRDDHVARGDAPVRRVLRGQAAVRVVHRHRAEEHDPRHPALGAVRGLGERDELDVAHPRPRALGERDDRLVRELGGLPEPVDLLLGLDQPQPRVRERDVDELEARQLLAQPGVVRVGHAHGEGRVDAHEPDAARW